MFKAGWVEIPVKDIKRAAKFYETVFELAEGEVYDDEGERLVIVYHMGSDAGEAGVSLNQTANFEPSDKGIFVYFNAGEDLTGHLNRVEGAGGKIVQGKTAMGDSGHYASIQDTEGNVIGLHSAK